MMNGCLDWQCSPPRGVCVWYWGGADLEVRYTHTQTITWTNTAAAESHRHTYIDAPPRWLTLQKTAWAVWLGCRPKWDSRRPSTRMAETQSVITTTYVPAHKHTNVHGIGFTHLRPKKSEVRIIGLASWLQTPQSVQGLPSSLHTVQAQSVQLWVWKRIIAGVPCLQRQIYT